jgi:hypothetical protein
MCVTNTTNRRPQALSFNANSVGVHPSLIAQRLVNTFAAPKQSDYDNSYVAQPTTSEFVQTSVPEKVRPKRRRKPQKPGKTARMNDRHFVVHNYHDHALESDEDDAEVDNGDDLNQRRRGGVSIAFPIKLHAVLDQVEADGLGHIVSWMPHGRCFVIHMAKEFVDLVMPK